MLGRPRQLPAELFKHDFVKFARTEKNARVKIRLLGLAHIQEGKSYREVAAMLKVTLSAPQRWVKRLAEGGIENLQEQPGRGRKRRLAMAKEESFRKAVQGLQTQRTGGRSRAKDVQALLKNKFKADYSLSSVYPVLHRAGLSWITARSRHSQSSAEVQEVFKKNLQGKS